MMKKEDRIPTIRPLEVCQAMLYIIWFNTEFIDYEIHRKLKTLVIYRETE